MNNLLSYRSLAIIILVSGTLSTGALIGAFVGSRYGIYLPILIYIAGGGMLFFSGAIGILLYYIIRNSLFDRIR
jgi:hypothetical protein